MCYHLPLKLWKFENVYIIDFSGENGNDSREKEKELQTTQSNNNKQKKESITDVFRSFVLTKRLVITSMAWYDINPTKNNTVT